MNLIAVEKNKPEPWNMCNNFSNWFGPALEAAVFFNYQLNGKEQLHCTEFQETAELTTTDMRKNLAAIQEEVVKLSELNRTDRV